MPCKINTQIRFCDHFYSFFCPVRREGDDVKSLKTAILSLAISLIISFEAFAGSVGDISSLTETDKDILLKITMAEAEGEDVVGKALVMRVVLNRVESSEFPGSVKAVVFQKRQFSPVWNGSYGKRKPNEGCYEALEMVLSGWDESQGALYFESRITKWFQKHLTLLFKHGRHYFWR